MSKKSINIIITATIIIVFIISVAYVVLYTGNKSPTKQIEPLSNNQQSITNDNSQTIEKQVTKIADSVFIADIFSNNEPWQTYTNQAKNISFEYPKDLFTLRETYLEPASGFRFTSESKEEWKNALGELVDDYCSGLGDPDCSDLWNWPQRYQSYQKAINGEEKFSFGYESVLVKQQAKKIGKITFLVGIDLGLNGACSLNYITFQNDTELHFTADICDDKFFQVYKYKGFPNGSFLNNKELINWAQNILNGTPSDFSITVKQSAIEKILESIKIQ